MRVGDAVPVSPSAGTSDAPVRELPGADTMACLIHHGPYDTFYQAYNALLEWTENNQYQIAGPDREVYVQGPDKARSPDEYVTELQVPVVKVAGA